LNRQPDTLPPAGFLELLRNNRNYRRMWAGQVVSEVGDHFNTVAVFSLALRNTGSGAVVSGIMIARALPMLLAGPLAGVLLDRMDRQRLMIASDLARAVIALGFIWTLKPEQTWLLFPLSALLMFASPFFTSGRAAILPVITAPHELHAANSLTKTTQWAAITLGAMLGGAAVARFGYGWAFGFNAASFLFSALCIAGLRAPRGFRPRLTALTESRVVQPWRDYVEGLRYIRSVRLLLAICLVHVGWATGGGAAQVLFPLFGEVVYPYGAAGLGTIWGFAGLGLLAGGTLSNWLGSRLNFDGFKRLVTYAFLLHGLAYVAFSQARPFWAVLLFIALSRVGMGIATVLNMTLLLRYVPDEFRGRVFATIETLTWATMMGSTAVAGLLSEVWEPRRIALMAGMASCSTAAIWVAMDWRGRLQPPPEQGIAPEEVEVHGEPAI